MTVVDELAEMLIAARAPRARGGTGQLETPHVDDVSDEDLRRGEFRAQLNENWTQELFSFRDDYSYSEDVENAWRSVTDPYYGGHDAYTWLAGMPTIYDEADPGPLPEEEFR